MKPARFLTQMKRNETASAYLFLGAEAYQGRRCREALLDVVLGPGERENGLALYDLTESSLAQVVDDARSLSLFAAQRVIVVSNADAALPRTKSDQEDDDEAPAADGVGELAAYLKDPPLGGVLLFEAARFGFEGDEKRKLERVRKFYTPVAETVELERFSMDEARAEAQLLYATLRPRSIPARSRCWWKLWVAM